MKRFVVLMIISLMLGGTYVSAVPLLNGAANFLEQSASAASTGRIDEAGMTLFALAALMEKIQGEDRDAVSTVKEYSDFLIDSQNPDGGWGYFKGSVSSVPSTAYAVIGLSAVQKLVSSGRVQLPPASIGASSYRGIAFLRAAFNGEAWGYVQDSPSEFYPTAMALWALGMAGYTDKDYYVFKGISYLENATPQDTRDMALRLIAFHYVGHRSDDALKDLSELKSEVLSGKLDTKDMALAVYALSLYNPGSFDTAKALALLEKKAIKVNDTYSWKNDEMFYSDAVLTTAYAALPFVSFIREGEDSYYETLLTQCEVLAESQNPSGTWGKEPGSSCEVCQDYFRTTYYSFLALLKCRENSTEVQKTVNWAKRQLPVQMGGVRLLGRITPGYYYTLKILLAAGALDEKEKLENIELIKSLQLPDGAWRGYPAGGQPLQTAMAIDLLSGLGIPSSDPAVVKGKKWLLSISGDGWGVYSFGPYVGYMITKDVFTTAFVINALSAVSTREELKSHVEWLLGQRNDDGVWGYVGGYTELYTSKYIQLGGAVEPTVLAAQALRRLDVDVTENVVAWLRGIDLSSLPLGGRALAIAFLLDHVHSELPTIYGTTRLLYYPSNFTLEYGPLYENVYPIVAGAIASGTPVFLHVKEGFDLSNNTTNYILLGTFDEINVAEFNPYLNYSVSGAYVFVDGNKYPTDSVVVVVPGRVHGSRVIAVVGSKRNYQLVEALFRTSLIKYLSGHYVVLRAMDSNGDGIIDPSEIRLVGEG